MAGTGGSKPLAAHAVTGLMWGVAGGLVGKSAGFLTQLYLGWVLSKEDFALYAVATSCSVIVAGLVNGGTQRVLIQRGERHDELAYTVFQISLTFNCVAMVALAALAFPVARLFEAPALVMMLVLMGIATVVSTPGSVLSAQLVSELRFRRVQMLAMCSHAVRNGATVLFAFLGFGPLSFVLPLVVVAITDDILVWKSVTQVPARRPFDRLTALGILRDSRWVMLGTVAGALVQNGGNIAVGLFADKQTLGVYFFALQLTFALASLVGGTFQSILVPTLVRMADDTERQRQALLNSVSAVAVASSGMAVLLVALAKPAISLLWKGKWDDAIPVVQILALGLPTLMVSWVAGAAIEARGAWSTVTALSLAEGVATVVAAAIGARVGGLPSIALAVLAVKLLAGLAYVAIAENRLGGRQSAAIRSVIAACFAALLALIIGYLGAVGPGALRLPATGESIFGTLVSVVAFLLLARVICRAGVSELTRVVRHVTGRAA